MFRNNIIKKGERVNSSLLYCNLHNTK